MEKLEKAKIISGITFRAIWLVPAVVCWIMGLVHFTQNKDSDGVFPAWAMWGAYCVIFVIVTILRMALGLGKDEARKGANEYTATRVGNTVYVSNHPIRSAIFGFLGGLVIGFLAGPIFLPLTALRYLVEIINRLLTLKQSV
ncbi:MAG: hypothetical protein IJY12_05645 [Clostridia bacterium]|nr:hypothetical protein [Clostridia bacterium]